MKIFAANWKLHKTPAETRAYLAEFKKLVGSGFSDKIVFFPPATSLESTAEALKGSAVFAWGAQNAFYEAKGAWTGEISPTVIQQMGGEWILIGHSERRKSFGETDEQIGKKLNFVQGLGLVPMLCVGETLAERESAQTEILLRRQLEAALAAADRKKALNIAYEPVWAIGTGRVATSDQVKATHAFIHQEVLRLGFPQSTPILYGGSVNAANATELLAIEHVDGVLVGGASLEVASFASVCQIR